MLARNTTWTLLHEGALKVQLAGVLYCDGQAFMVPKGDGAKTITALAGATVCVKKGISSENQLPEYFAAKGLNVKPFVVDDATKVADAFSAGRCAAYTADASQLAAARLRAPGGPPAYIILLERISKEPLGSAGAPR